MHTPEPFAPGTSAWQQAERFATAAVRVPQQDRDDMLQSVRERLLRWGRAAGSCNVARGAAVDWVRHKLGRPGAPVENTIRLGWARREIPTELMEEVATAPTADTSYRWVWEVLDAMPRRDRSLLVGRYIEGHTQRELAHQHQVTESCVSLWMQRARRRFIAAMRRTETQP